MLLKKIVREGKLYNFSSKYAVKARGTTVINSSIIFNSIYTSFQEKVCVVFKVRKDA